MLTAVMLLLLPAVLGISVMRLVQLPRLDGQQVCERLRQQGSQTPILMLTSLDALPDKLASFAAGADDYLVKPFELAELVARIRALSVRRSDPEQAGCPKQFLHRVLDRTLAIQRQRKSRWNPARGRRAWDSASD